MKLKGLIFIMLVAVFSVYMPSITEASAVNVEIDGTRISFDQGAILKDGRTLVPVRKIFEELDAVVNYDSKTRVITAIREDRKIVLTVGSNVVMVDNKRVTLDVPAQVLNGRTLVPLRFISEALGAEVSWEAVTRTAKIKTYSEYVHFFFANRASTMGQKLTEAQFDREFQKMHKDQELVGYFQTSFLLDKVTYFESYHTTAWQINGKWYDFYLETEGYSYKGQTVGEYTLYVYDPVTYEVIKEVSDQLRGPVISGGLTFSITSLLRDGDFRQNVVR